MLSDFTGADKVYIACGYTDLRRGIDGLAAIVQQEFQLDPFTNTLFLFCGRRRDRIKTLYWEGNGFVLLYKRLGQTNPVLDALLVWANSRTAAPKSALGRALNYLKEQWPYLTYYLKDGRLEISNNRAERSIKPVVIDRKNFLFANTPKGATGSAVMFSMIQTAIENGLDPYRYLTWLLKTANNADLNDRQTVQALLPWNASMECRYSASK